MHRPAVSVTVRPRGERLELWCRGGAGRWDRMRANLDLVTLSEGLQVRGSQLTVRIVELVEVMDDSGATQRTASSGMEGAGEDLFALARHPAGDGATDVRFEGNRLHIGSLPD